MARFMFIIYWNGASFPKAPKQITNKDETKVALIFCKSNKLITFPYQKMRKIELNTNMNVKIGIMPLCGDDSCTSRGTSVFHLSSVILKLVENVL